MQIEKVQDISPISYGPFEGGVQAMFRFENGYGASVVNHPYSYGTELTVLEFTGDDTDDWELCYTTPITSDVVGHIQDEQELYGLLLRIRDLPARVRGIEAESAPSALESADEDEDTEDDFEAAYGPHGDSEYDALEAFEDMLNDVHETVIVCGYSYDPARALRELDPVAYREEFNNWIDAEIQDWVDARTL